MPGLPVLDSSAVLTVLSNEPSRARVEPILQYGLLSTVNLVEIHTRLIRNSVPAHIAWRQILDLRCTSVPFSEEHARLAAELVSLTKPYGLSLGDRACLALAIESNAAVYTTDQAWLKLALDIKVEVIR